MDRPQDNFAGASFASDNTAPATPEVMEALSTANRGPQPAYGADEITARLERRFAELFEHDVAVFPVATGTAANALALSACTTPWGLMYSHRLAHVNEHEAGAPEFYSGGTRLVPLDGPNGKLSLDALKSELDAAGFGVVHESQPQAVTITQASEAGTLYRLDEIRAIADLVHGRGMTLHMDGARFANAAAGLGTAPADLTWRAGIDIMSFGATKNGALAAEAVIAFDPALATSLAFRRKRAGHLLSKQRYLSAQIEAGLIDGRWLGWARHANAMAQHLAQGLTALGVATLDFPVEANEIFVRLPEPVIAGLEADGFAFPTAARRPTSSSSGW